MKEKEEGEKKKEEGRKKKEEEGKKKRRWDDLMLATLINLQYPSHSLHTGAQIGGGQWEARPAPSLLMILCQSWPL